MVAESVIVKPPSAKLNRIDLIWGEVRHRNRHECVRPCDFVEHEPVDGRPRKREDKCRLAAVGSEGRRLERQAVDTAFRRIANHGLQRVRVQESPGVRPLNSRPLHGRQDVGRYHGIEDGPEGDIEGDDGEIVGGNGHIFEKHDGVLVWAGTVGGVEGPLALTGEGGRVGTVP